MYNKGKVVEFKDFFELLGFEVVFVVDFDLDELDEMELIFEGNVLIKVCVVVQVIGVFVFLDDSGFEVSVFGGMFGVYMVLWVGELCDFYVVMEKVECELIVIVVSDCSVKFVSCFVVVWLDGYEEIFCGEVYGSLIWLLCGEMGFGYDLVFVLVGYEVMFVEFELYQKYFMSYCVVVFDKFKKVLF